MEASRDIIDNLETTVNNKNLIIQLMKQNQDRTSREWSKSTVVDVKKNFDKDSVKTTATHSSNETGEIWNEWIRYVQIFSIFTSAVKKAWVYVDWVKLRNPKLKIALAFRLRPVLLKTTTSIDGVWFL